MVFLLIDVLYIEKAGWFFWSFALEKQLALEINGETWKYFFLRKAEKFELSKIIFSLKDDQKVDFNSETVNVTMKLVKIPFNFNVYLSFYEWRCLHIEHEYNMKFQFFQLLKTFTHW